MSLAIAKAWEYQVLTFPNPPVGCVIAKDDMIISIEAHKKSGEAHSEVNAIKMAYYRLSHNADILSISDPKEIHNFLYKYHNNLFNKCTLYTTLEPCNHYGKTPPCSLLIKNLKFAKVVIGSIDESKIASGGIKELQEENIKIEFSNKKQCDDLLQGFIDYQANNFVFFKYASSLNGVISGGYLSCSESLVDVHRLRNNCDLLVIGGNTVRVDRPTLDARLVNGKAPDILIYSKMKNFDKSIPLFSIQNRNVFIRDDLELINKYKCIMIEGGENMLRSVKNKVNHFLIYMIPALKSSNNIKLDLELEFLNYTKSGNDIKAWCKPKNL